VSAERILGDRRAREEAQRRFEGCLVLEAGAGTGKTTVLVSRVAAWCLGPGWARSQAALAGEADEERVARRVLSRVVAITFTEAAAAEMEIRIGSALRDVEAGKLPVGLQSEGLPPEAVRGARARSLVAALDQLVVQSIHAFCRRLLAAHPLEASLHPRFEVDGDGEGQRRVVREVLQEQVVLAFAEGGESDLARVCLEDAGADKLEAGLLRLVEEGAPPELFDAEVHTPERVGALRDELVAAFRELLAAEGGRAAGIPSGQKIHEVLQAAREALAAAEAAPADAGGLASLAALLAESWSPSRLDCLRRWARDDFGRAEAQRLGAAAAAFGSAAGGLRPLVRHVASLDPPRLDRARRVVGALLRAVHARLRAEGLVPFATLLGAADELLARREDVAAGERRKIDQLLVDEFQDTDPVQCRIVRRLALEGPAEERPGLFLVGDPKQSIYGWRSADLGAYHGFLEGVAAAGPPLRLSINRRSPAAILEEVERAVADRMRPEPGVQPSFEALVADPERTLAVPERPLEAWVTGARGTSVAECRSAEADALARDLRRLYEDELARGDEPRWGRCAVLVRASSDLDAYLEALRRADIPYAVESDRSYYQRREVLDASALVRAVVDPSDTLALVAALRSPWVGVPDAAWMPLWARQLPRLAASLYGRADPRLAEAAAAVRAAARTLPEGVPGLAALAGWEESLVAALGDLAALRASFEEDAPDRFVERLRRVMLPEASEAARFEGGHRLANLERFFRELSAWLEEGLADAAGVARHLREAAARPPDPFEGPPRSPAGDAVRVMTIHKAKGLDFDHVYVLGIEKETSGRNEPVRVCRADELREYQLFGAATPGFHRLEAARARKEAAEQVRTLYVALTRARRRLVVSGRWKGEGEAPAQPESFADLLALRRGGLPDFAQELGRARAEGRSELSEGGVVWRFVSLEAADAPAAAPDRAGEASRRAEALAASQRLAELGGEAHRRAARRRSRGAAAEKDAESGEARLEAAFGAEGGATGEPAARRDAALALGGAVHAALEALDLSEAPADARRRAERVLAATLRAELGEAAGPSLARGRELLGRFFEGGLFARLAALGDALLARELPVLLEPDPEDPGAPVGFWSGAIDLLYFDAAAGEYVVADYKTDRVEAGAVAEAAERYRSQGGVYTRAVRRALGLSKLPRFELWFLHPGRVVAVAPGEEPAPS
jgi:ATP-dependent helicase/nuclease subunit A